MKRRRLGQHFLIHGPTARRIVEAAAPGPADLVIEIGPGRGGLTGPLLETGARVRALELDPELCRETAARLEGGRLEVVRGDALTADFEALVRSGGAERAVLVGNLPYRITGALLERILDAHKVWRRALVMVQREVGRRLTAGPGSRDFGILSIAAAIRGTARRVCDVPPHRFSPPPRVHSTVVRLDFPTTPPFPIEDEELFFHVVRSAFQQRRKKLRNALKGLQPGAGPEALLAAAGVDPEARAEQLPVERFVAIAHQAAAAGGGDGPS